MHSIIVDTKCTQGRTKRTPKNIFYSAEQLIFVKKSSSSRAAVSPASRQQSRDS